jgi:hypothetical protein
MIVACTTKGEKCDREVGGTGPGHTPWVYTILVREYVRIVHPYVRAYSYRIAKFIAKLNS